MSSNILQAAGQIIGGMIGGPAGAMIGGMIGDMLGQAITGQASSASADSGLPFNAQSIFNQNYGSGFNLGLTGP